eukprot:comp22647_c0_seq2/m.34903 comp22647_c0_seq2/g.34903  ORF comp22647_c0_seq2/g.34903 comp22647_c0_seq2/m.34903 type:complete len:160 (-) comp22647_c0_seq2:81-560(-)
MGTSLVSPLSGAVGGSLLDESEYAPFDWLSEDAHILPEAFLAKFNTSLLPQNTPRNGSSATNLNVNQANMEGRNNNTRQAQAADTRQAQSQQLLPQSQASKSHLSFLPELDWSGSDDVDMGLVDDPWTDPYQHYVMLQMEVGRTPAPRQQPKTGFTKLS